MMYFKSRFMTKAQNVERRRFEYCCVQAEDEAEKPIPSNSKGCNLTGAVATLLKNQFCNGGSMSKLCGGGCGYKMLIKWGGANIQSIPPSQLADIVRPE